MKNERLHRTSRRLKALLFVAEQPCWFYPLYILRFVAMLHCIGRDDVGEQVDRAISIRTDAQ